MNVHDVKNESINEQEHAVFVFFLIGIPCHYEAWSYENEKEAQKRLQHIGNMFTKNLQFKDVC